MKARRRPFSGTLDSLMDTTTNVVGILVIVLVITQLGVSSAVKRIRDNLPAVTQEDLEKQREEVRDLRVMAARLGEGAPAIESQTAIDEALLASTKEAADQLAAQIEATRQEIEAATKAQQSVDEAMTNLKELEAQLATAKAEASRLKAMLAAAPTTPRPSPKEIHLPNPRSAPQGAQPLVVLCKADRAIAVPVEGLRNLAEARIRQLRLPADKDGAVDGQKLVDYFDKVDVGNRHFRLRIRLYNHVPFLVFDLRPEAGDTIEAMHKGDSTVGVELHRADAKRQFARFLVWSDGFDAYGQARTIADAAKLPAGWEPMLPNQFFQMNISSTVKVQKPPAPPPPKDPTPPSKPPTGGEPIAPPKPPLPRDDID